jgi:hypothetical protein
MATPQAIALFNALKNIRAINSKLAATDGALTSTVCLAYDELVLIFVSLLAITRSSPLAEPSRT